MRTFAHIVHPFKAAEDSDLFVAQPVTFETMRLARRFSEEHVTVEFHSAQYAEDRSVVPDGFAMTPDLSVSVSDVASFSTPLRLPLLRDVLDRVVAATDAEYVIYSGVDIPLQPYFYETVDRLVDAGVDAMIINRRVLPGVFRSIDDLPLMYATIGKPHPGRDCFVFRRDDYARYDVGDACLGMRRVGAVLALNLIYHSNCFRELRDSHLTFHLGDRSFWKDPRYADYHAHNLSEFTRVRRRLSEEFPDVRSPLVERMSRSDAEKGL